MAKKQLKPCKACGEPIAKNAKKCPHCGAKNKKSILKRWWFWVIVLVVFVGVAGGTRTNGSTTAKTTEPTAPVSYSAVSVSQLMTDLKANAMKAQETYKNQYLEITGKLSNIDSDGKYISLVPADDAFAFTGVQCYIRDDTQKNQVMNMHGGDTVTLRGKCTDVGEVLGYSLKIDSIDGYDAVAEAAKNAVEGYIQCSASDLVSDLKNNALKAQTMYKGQQLEVTGKLSNIDSSGKYINIEPVNDPYSFTIIQCYIKTDEVKNSVMNLSVGNTVTIKGKCTDVGELMGYSINIETVK